MFQRQIHNIISIFISKKLNLALIYRVLPLGLCLLLSCCASTNNIVSESDINSLLKVTEKKAYLVGQFEADFHKIIKSSLFNHEPRIDGRLVFQKPNRFQLTLTGDVDLQIVSDGKFLAIIHDKRDLELYNTNGDRGASGFSDPMMLLVNSLTNGETSRFANMTQQKHKDSTVMEIEPGDVSEFEAIKNVKVKFSDQGTIESITMLFKNGNIEKTIFDSWSLLAQDDPKIRRMNEQIRKIASLTDSNPVTNLFRIKPDETLTSISSGDHGDNRSRTSKLESNQNRAAE
ncbi:MAG: outer membrane lipoprotein carrier protein LolA [Desulfomonilaceae bacterium]